MRVMRGWAGESSSDPPGGVMPPFSAFPERSPGLPASLGWLRDGAEQVDRRQRLGCAVAGEAPAYFAFQLVCEAASIFVAAQCALSPRLGLGEQIVVV